MDSLLTNAFYLTSAPVALTLILLYKSGQCQWHRLLMSAFLILVGGVGVYTVYGYASIPKLGVTQFVRDYLIFGYGLIASLGVGCLLIALDYSEKREELMRQLVAKHERREKRKRDELQIEIYRRQAEYLRIRAFEAFDPTI
jgi:hypothetical protein